MRGFAAARMAVKWKAAYFAVECPAAPLTVGAAITVVTRCVTASYTCAGHPPGVADKVREAFSDAVLDALPCRLRAAWSFSPK